MWGKDRIEEIFQNLKANNHLCPLLPQIYIHCGACTLLSADKSGFWAQAMAQVGGLVMLQPEVGGSRDSFFFAGIDKVRFRKPVIAGDTLVMRMTLVKFQKRFGIAKMEGKAYVGCDLVCEGEFLMASGSV
ncbi:unnamed protein product [Prunus armeniaca]|uniref:Beta-hydroxyacyl-ACP dehydratase n=1 Tax=Prunus armeniaca TaxID=36596 RepID=A0A6J5V570_PRUAR|nr:unnamed protein product [Prunus armeniaca]CAB4313828.1 unnamed protein product [Prunus armeniaca]